MLLSCWYGSHGRLVGGGGTRDGVTGWGWLPFQTCDVWGDGAGPSEKQGQT